MNYVLNENTDFFRVDLRIPSRRTQLPGFVISYLLIYINLIYGVEEHL